MVTGRIINILYLVLKGLLDFPILYLIRFIIEHKSDYYRLIQAVHQDNQLEAWILFILKGVEVTAKQTTATIKSIKTLMQSYQENIRANFRFYSQDLLNNLFRHPYTKIELVEKELGISRLTATNYLEQLTQAGFLEKHKIWRYNYYINRPLFQLITEPPSVE